MVGYIPINPTGDPNEDAFGQRFFRSKFLDRIKLACSIDDQTPVLEIMLANGQVLDVSYIIELKDEYALMAVFVDERDCRETYETYIRYRTIFKINVLTPKTKDRPIGFSLNNAFDEEE